LDTDIKTIFLDKIKIIVGLLEKSKLFALHYTST